MAETAPPAPGLDSDVVRHNDLLVIRSFLDQVIASGLDSLDAIFAATNDDSFSKPGLDPWRERLCVRIDHARNPQPGEQRAIPIDDSLGAASGIRTVFVKRYTRPPRRACRQVLRARCGARSFAGLEWTWLRAFGEHGIAAAEPIAFGEELRGGIETRSAILIAPVPGASLESIVLRTRPGQSLNIRKVSPHLARLIARMHRCGFIHRDLYLAHVFYDSASWPENCLRLIDLQRVLRPRILLNRWIVKDLAALNYSTPTTAASSADRFRWLVEYLRGRTVSEAEVRRSARRLAYRIAGKTLQIARHDRARTQRLAAVSGGTPA